MDESVPATTTVASDKSLHSNPSLPPVGLKQPSIQSFFSRVVPAKQTTVEEGLENGEKEQRVSPPPAKRPKTTTSSSCSSSRRSVLAPLTPDVEKTAEPHSKTSSPASSDSGGVIPAFVASPPEKSGSDNVAFVVEESSDSETPPMSTAAADQVATCPWEDPLLKAKPVVKLQKLEEYEVEKIVDYSWCALRNQGLYHVKWLGWDEKDNTWEPACNLDCEEKLKEFYLQRMAEREKATPAQKRCLAVPPDPRTHIEKRTDFVDRIFNPPCFAELEKFYVANRKKPVKSWTEAVLRKALDELSKKKKINEEKLSKVKEQLMLRYMREARKDQQARLKEWEDEINQHEHAKIIVQNDADLEGPARHMTYITKYKPSEGIIIPDDPPIGCECAGGACDLRTEDTCCPANNATLFPYDRWGRLRVDVGNAIFECNKKCKCGDDCKTKVVQKGRKTKLCIYRTDNGCGWGVRALESIKEGAFVVEYVGEVIGNEEAEERGKQYDAEGRTYLFDLDFNRGNDNIYTVDAAHFGNVAHFINHSCDPNLSIFNVWIDCLDPDLPRLCLFARRDIVKGEQITFDYCQQTTQNCDVQDVVMQTDSNSQGTIASDISTDVSHKRMDETNSAEGNHEDRPEKGKTECRCQAKNCRRWLFD